jgi:sugar O-acyltransferase (sialic acid O-acetyltransferase NeuD family)
VVWSIADQCRVNSQILASLGCETVAFVCDEPVTQSSIDGKPVLHGWPGLLSWVSKQSTRDFGFIVAIGNPYGHIRCRLDQNLRELGIQAMSFADPTALICRNVTIDEGLQVMPSAIIHNDAIVHRNCIINTRALVEHDCILEDGVEIGPGAVLCGRVFVGANTWIGAGVTVRPKIRIGRNSIIGAGAVVVSDIPDGVVAIGVPARPVKGSTTISAQACEK